MIIRFQTKDVTFFEEDRAYFKKRMQGLLKPLGWEVGDEDSIELEINLEKDKQHSGNRFISSAKLIAPHGGNFYAETNSDNIKQCADELKKKLKIQIMKFHEKKK